MGKGKQRQALNQSLELPFKIFIIQIAFINL